MGRVIQGDCLTVLPTLPQARMIFADPPDNLGLKYAGFRDKRVDYIPWLADVVFAALAHKPEVFWLSLYHRHELPLLIRLGGVEGWDLRQFIWRFTFGQHQERDCGNGYRPILRFSRPGINWNTNAIRVPSARQEKYHDTRANPEGRVPDDVWQFSRVCGTFHERRTWHPTQHPEALMERIVKLSGGPVIDLFGGTFTTQRVCDRLGIECTSIEISPEYCRKVRLPIPTVK